MACSSRGFVAELPYIALSTATAFSVTMAISSSIAFCARAADGAAPDRLEIGGERRQRVVTAPSSERSGSVSRRWRSTSAAVSSSWTARRPA